MPAVRPLSHAALHDPYRHLLLYRHGDIMYRNKSDVQKNPNVHITLK